MDMARSNALTRKRDCTRPASATCKSVGTHWSPHLVAQGPRRSRQTGGTRRSLPRGRRRQNSTIGVEIVTVRERRGGWVSAAPCTKPWPADTNVQRPGASEGRTTCPRAAAATHVLTFSHMLRLCERRRTCASARAHWMEHENSSMVESASQHSRVSRAVLNGRRGGVVWDPKVCVPKIARKELPCCEFRSSPQWSLWSGGRGVQRGGGGLLLAEKRIKPRPDGE